MLAFQTVTPWHDRTLLGMEREPPPKRRRVTSDRDSTTSVASVLPYGWVSEHVVAADRSSESATPTYPTLLANSYWSQPQETWSSYRTEGPTSSDAHTARFGHSSSAYSSERYGSYDTQDLEWQEFGDGSLSSFSETVPPQIAAASSTEEQPHHLRPAQPPSSSSWDIMTSGPGGVQYEYLDTFTRQCQASQGNFAPYVEAPVLRSNLPMGGKTSMPPPAQPHANPQKGREVLRDFEVHLENTLEDMQSSMLSTAADELLAASRVLMNNSRDLKLFCDKLDGNEPAPDWRSRRREIWHQFNTTWLGLLTKQMDLSQQERSGYGTPTSRSRISRATLSVIGFEMRSLADKIKDFGLIDYEQGFNERRITEVFEVCVDLANELEGPTPSWSDSGATGGSQTYQFQGP